LLRGERRRALFFDDRGWQITIRPSSHPPDTVWLNASFESREGREEAEWQLVLPLGGRRERLASSLVRLEVVKNGRRYRRESVGLVPIDAPERINMDALRAEQRKRYRDTLEVRCPPCSPSTLSTQVDILVDRAGKPAEVQFARASTMSAEDRIRLAAAIRNMRFPVLRVGPRRYAGWLSTVVSVTR
jgi:hypothetical protein